MYVVRKKKWKKFCFIHFYMKDNWINNLFIDALLFRSMYVDSAKILSQFFYSYFWFCIQAFIEQNKPIWWLKFLNWTFTSFFGSVWYNHRSRLVLESSNIYNLLINESLFISFKKNSSNHAMNFFFRLQYVPVYFSEKCWNIWLNVNTCVNIYIELKPMHLTIQTNLK